MNNENWWKLHDDINTFVNGTHPIETTSCDGVLTAEFIMVFIKYDPEDFS